MKKFNIVKKNEDFKKVIKNGRYYKNPCFVIYIYNNNLNHYRFGISVSKKLGNAVVRNKIKRQMRNIIDKYKNYYSNQLDYIIIVKKDYNMRSFNEVENNFLTILESIKKRRSKNEK